jgi:hypothetical protein
VDYHALCAHINHAHCLDANPRRFGKEQARGLAGFDTAPELFLGSEQETLVERISGNGKFDPVAAPGDDRKHRHPGVGHPHVVLDLRHVFLRRRRLGE